MKVLSVVGARPQFIKEAAVGRVLRRDHHEVLVHTGQHYDADMSDVFFEELKIPKPDHSLGIGGGSHGEQTGRMLAALERVIRDEAPDAVLVYGDTNSTVAAALAAVKLHVPVAHVEAGLRSFDRRMPEEINRVLTDHASALLFAPTDAAMRNLENEGLAERARRTGDVMADVLRHNLDLAKAKSVRAKLGLDAKRYHVATLHRPSNVDDPATLRRILEALGAAELPVVLPLHPRTRAVMENTGLPDAYGSVRFVPPQGYLEFLDLVANARKVVTDSGGLQKEAYLLGVPCITAREQTEWVETVEEGWNVLVGNDPQGIREAIRSFEPEKPQNAVYGANAAEEIVRLLPELAATL